MSSSGFGSSGLGTVVYQADPDASVSVQCEEPGSTPTITSCADGLGSDIVPQSTPAAYWGGYGFPPDGAVGPHAYTVTGKDSAGNSASATFNYTVKPLPTPTITVTGLSNYQRVTLHMDVRNLRFSCNDGPGAVKSCETSSGAESHSQFGTDTYYSGPGDSTGITRTGYVYGTGTGTQTDTYQTTVYGSHTYTVTATTPTGVTATKVIHYIVVPPCVVPRLAGRSLRNARAALGRAHCGVGRIRYAYSRVRKGVVLSSKPRRGTSLANGARVALTVSSGRRR